MLVSHSADHSLQYSSVVVVARSLIRIGIITYSFLQAAAETEPLYHFVSQQSLCLSFNRHPQSNTPFLRELQLMGRINNCTGNRADSEAYLTETIIIRFINSIIAKLVIYSNNYNQFVDAPFARSIVLNSRQPASAVQ